MVKVLFVCLGNICRSPMAEAVFRHLVNERGLDGQIVVDSAGTGSWHVGEPPHEGTRRILSENDIDYSASAPGKSGAATWRNLITSSPWTPPI